MPALTLPEKIWDRHVVRSAPGEPDLLYIDLHLVHEVTSPQAFDGLRLAGRPVRRPDLTVATEDHNVPTVDIDQPIADPISARQIAVLRENSAEFGITLYPMGDPGQGIVHVIGPEQGRTLPGMTIVCGDSHTATHGAFGALAFGIGTSEVEHVLATQTLTQTRPKWMAVELEGEPPPGVTAKDLILGVIGEIGTGGGLGHVIEYRGAAVRSLSMEGRMTMCNMSIEAGARAGLVAPDDTTFAYLEGRPHAPQGKAWAEAVEDWSSLHSDDDARWDRVVRIDATALRPQVTWGTNPGQVTSIDGAVPSPDDYADTTTRSTVERALEYMQLTPGTPMRDIAVDTVFIGSCTNSRIEDLRAAANVLEGRQVTAARVMVVPGSHAVKAQAEAEGLDRIFTAAGADWRQPGCSMCLAMNPDKLAPGERAASTSNRNFEGRQGRGGRTHLVSPAVAAATAVAGHFATPEDFVMKAVRVVSGSGLPLRRSDVDTDQIIPAEWLKRVERTGFERGLFATWRDDRDFVLNDERYRQARVIVAGPAFGVGSSREHAVWAIQQYGFDAVIAPSFSDIFHTNCTKNGLVPVTVSEEVVERIWRAIEDDPETEIVVDLERLVLEVPAIGLVEEIRMDPAVQHRFLHGLDDVGITLGYDAAITEFEQQRPSWTR